MEGGCGRFVRKRGFVQAASFGKMGSAAVLAGNGVTAFWMEEPCGAFRRTLWISEPCGTVLLTANGRSG